MKLVKFVRMPLEGICNHETQVNKKLENSLNIAHENGSIVSVRYT